MRIGFDCDGPLADFISSYQRLVIQTAHGLNLFEPGDDVNPPCWNWPEFRGYSDDTMKLVWKQIIESPSFWYSLAPTDGASTLAMFVRELEHRHDVYYITARPGQTAKRQTEAWLTYHLNYTTDVRPTVLICSDKAAAARALKLDVYIDDNYDNVVSVVKDVGDTCRTYLLNKRYNQGKDMVSVVTGTKGKTPCQQRITVHEERPIRRINSVGAMFDAELKNL